MELGLWEFDYLITALQRGYFFLSHRPVYCGTVSSIRRGDAFLRSGVGNFVIKKWSTVYSCRYNSLSSLLACTYCLYYMEREILFPRRDRQEY